MQHEEGRLWTPGVIKEANKSDHRGRSYFIRVMKMGKLIMQNIRHIQHPINCRVVPLGTDGKKGSRWLEEIFMRTLPVEHDRMVRLHATDSWAHMTHSNVSYSDRVKESKHVTPIQQDQKTSLRHIACDDKPDCITSNITPTNMTMKGSLTLVKGEMWTRSGKMGCRLVRLGINTQ